MEELFEKAKNIFENELAPILQSKGHDYSGMSDCHSNLRDFGWKGVIVRIGDKFHRLQSFMAAQTLAVADEKIEDTIKDLVNYGFISYIMLTDSSPISVIERNVQILKLINDSIRFKRNLTSFGNLVHGHKHLTTLIDLLEVEYKSLVEICMADAKGFENITSLHILRLTALGFLVLMAYRGVLSCQS